MRIDFDEERHIYTVDGKKVPSVTEMLSYATAKHYGNINESVLRQAAQRGTDVHEACQDIDYGLEVKADPVIAPYVKAYVQFLCDYLPEWEEIEQKHYNENLVYCGTVDRMGKINGRKAIVDIKTVSSISRTNYIVYSAQTYAYSRFYDDGCDFDRYILVLKKDGKYRLVNLGEWEQKQKVFGVGQAVFYHCFGLYYEFEE